MALRTAFTELLSLRHPIALAPMGGTTGGALVAAVSNGGGRADPGWSLTLLSQPGVRPSARHRR